MSFWERYKVDFKTDKVGEGGFSWVYRAYDSLEDDYFAIKVLFANKLPEKYDLVREISRVKNLGHENLCRYYYADKVMLPDGVNGAVQMVQVGIMEYVDGGDIRRYVREHPGATHKLLIDVLQGLAYLHDLDFIHRDLKPQNILVSTVRGPVAKLTDFGISKKLSDTPGTSVSMLIGSMLYMAPEQFDTPKYGIDGKIATNIDLWSFGIMTYELISGNKFFDIDEQRTQQGQLMGKILGTLDLAKIATLPEPYRSVVSRCLVQDASKRARKAGELIDLMKKGAAGDSPAPHTRILHTQVGENRGKTDVGGDIGYIKVHRGRNVRLVAAVVITSLSILLAVYFLLPGNAPQEGAENGAATPTDSAVIIREGDGRLDSTNHEDPIEAAMEKIKSQK